MAENFEEEIERLQHQLKGQDEVIGHQEMGVLHKDIEDLNQTIDLLHKENTKLKIAMNSFGSNFDGNYHNYSKKKQLDIPEIDALLKKIQDLDKQLQQKETQSADYKKFEQLKVENED